MCFFYLYREYRKLIAKNLAQEKVIESQGLVIAKLQHQLRYSCWNKSMVNKIWKGLFHHKPADFYFHKYPQIEPEVQKGNPIERKEIVYYIPTQQNHKGRRLTEGM